MNTRLSDINKAVKTLRKMVECSELMFDNKAEDDPVKIIDDIIVPLTGKELLTMAHLAFVEYLTSEDEYYRITFNTLVSEVKNKKSKARVVEEDWALLDQQMLEAVEKYNQKATTGCTIDWKLPPKGIQQMKMIVFGVRNRGKTHFRRESVFV